MADISKITTLDGVTYDIKDTTARSSIPAAASSSPLMDGTATTGTSTKYAKEDHIHPSDTTRVNKAGDIMTGTLTTGTELLDDGSNNHTVSVMVKTAIDTETIPVSNQWYRVFAVKDRDDNIRGYFGMSDTTVGQGVQIETCRNINNELIYNGLRLNITEDGTRTVSLHEPSIWRTAINAVNKSGDTMTGDLNVEQSGQSAIWLKNNHDYIVAGSAPTNSEYVGVVHGMSYDGTAIGSFMSRYIKTSGTNPLGIAYAMLRSRNKNGDSNVDNTLNIGSRSDGLRIVSFSNPEAWLKGLGLGDSSGNLPITVNQGGTGVTTATANNVFAAPNGSNGAPSFRSLVAADIPNLNASKITAGILPIARGGTGDTEVNVVTTISEIASASTGFKITSAYYRSWGKVAMLRIQVEATSAKASGGAVVVTVVSGKRPGHQCAVQAGVVSSAYLNSNGQLSYAEAMAANSTVTFLATYILA